MEFLFDSVNTRSLLDDKGVEWEDNNKSPTENVLYLNVDLTGPNLRSTPQRPDGFIAGMSWRDVDLAGLFCFVLIQLSRLCGAPSWALCGTWLLLTLDLTLGANLFDSYSYFSRNSRKSQPRVQNLRLLLCHVSKFIQELSRLTWDGSRNILASVYRNLSQCSPGLSLGRTT